MNPANKRMIRKFVIVIAVMAVVMLGGPILCMYLNFRAQEQALADPVILARAAFADQSTLCRSLAQYGGCAYDPMAPNRITITLGGMKPQFRFHFVYELLGTRDFAPKLQAQGFRQLTFDSADAKGNEVNIDLTTDPPSVMEGDYTP